MAADHGEAIGIYAAAILDTPLPWTKTRQVYRLLGLVKKWGAGRVEQACRRALDAEAVDVNLVSSGPERPPKPRPRRPRCSSRDALPVTTPSSLSHRCADEHAHSEHLARDQGSDAPPQTGPAHRHLARTPCLGAHSRTHARRVPRTGTETIGLAHGEGAP